MGAMIRFTPWMIGMSSALPPVQTSNAYALGVAFVDYRAAHQQLQHLLPQMHSTNPLLAHDARSALSLIRQTVGDSAYQHLVQPAYSDPFAGVSFDTGMNTNSGALALRSLEGSVETNGGWFSKRVLPSIVLETKGLPSDLESSPLLSTGNPLSSTFVPRDYQEEAITNVINAVREGKRGGLIVMPTGTGKTATFVQCAKRINAEGLLGNRKTLVLVHRVELVDQAQKAFESQLGVGTVSVMSAGRKSRDVRGTVVVAGVQTLASDAMLEQFDPEAFGLVIVDETHHIVADTWRKILERLGLIDAAGFGVKAEGKFLLGVTATPDRSDDVHLSIPFPDGLLFSKPLLWFVLKKYLLKPQGVLMTTSAALSQVSIGANGDYNESELGSVMSRGQVLNEIVQAYENLTPGKRALVFATNVEHAYALAEAFNRDSKKRRAEAIDGTMDPEERKEIIAQHKRGEIDLLINFGILTEGYDDPGIEAVYVARPTRSRSLYVQMVGRGLRPDPEHPEKSSVDIVDITGSILDHQLDMDLAKLFNVEYVGTGLPMLDVVDAQLEMNEALQDQEKRQKAEELDEIEGMSAFEVNMLRTLSAPLAYLLYEALTKKFDGDISRMAWQLGMREDVLANYAAGVFPDRQTQVEQDFQRAFDVLGLDVEQIVKLWRQSRAFHRIGNALQVVQRLHDEHPDMPLMEFLHLMASSLQRELGLRSEMKNPIRNLCLQLRCWEDCGQDVSSMEAIIDAHDREGSGWTRERRTIDALFRLSRTRSMNKESLMAEARERGLLQGEEGARGYYDVIKKAWDLSIPVKGFEATLGVALALRNPILFGRNYVDRDLPLGVPLQSYRDGIRLGSCLTEYLMSDEPLEKRSRLYEAMKRQQIALDLDAILNRMQGRLTMQSLGRSFDEVFEECSRVESAKLSAGEPWQQELATQLRAAASQAYPKWMADLMLKDIQSIDFGIGKIAFPVYEAREAWMAARWGWDAASMRRQVADSGDDFMTLASHVLTKYLQDVLQYRALHELADGKIMPTVADIERKLKEHTGRSVRELVGWNANIRFDVLLKACSVRSVALLDMEMFFSKGCRDPFPSLAGFDQWQRERYGVRSLEVQTLFVARLSEVIVRVTQRLQENHSCYIAEFDAAMREEVGAGWCGIQDWESCLKVDIPRFDRPQTPEDRVHEIVLLAIKNLPPKATPSTRQLHVREALAKAGVGIEQVLQRASRFDPQAALGKRDADLIKLLFGNPADGGASFPRPTPAAGKFTNQALSEVMKRAVDSWRRDDGVKMRQQRIRDAFQHAGYDFDDIVKQALAWDESTADKDQKYMLMRLFNPSGAGGAGFKRQKK